MITIKQSAEKVGRSELTIRRLIKSSLLDNPKLLGKTISQRKGAYVVDEAWLESQYPVASPKNDPITQQTTLDEQIVQVATSQAEALVHAKNETIALLSRELDLLTEQLKAKDEQIGSMNQRASETNVLMARLQERLAIDAPRTDSLSRAPRGSVSHEEAEADERTATDHQIVAENPKRGWFRRRK